MLLKIINFRGGVLIPLATARGAVSFRRPLHGLNILETLFPSSELLGYNHSSALRTHNYFSGKAPWGQNTI